MKSSGLFITFEGMDGSGKTTQMHRYQQRTADGHLPHHGEVRPFVVTLHKGSMAE